MDATDDVVAVKKVDVSVGKAIQQARQEKKLTQKELATKVNENQTLSMITKPEELFQTNNYWPN